MKGHTILLLACVTGIFSPLVTGICVTPEEISGICNCKETPNPDHYLSFYCMYVNDRELFRNVTSTLPHLYTLNVITSGVNGKISRSLFGDLQVQELFLDATEFTEVDEDAFDGMSESLRTLQISATSNMSVFPFRVTNNLTKLHDLWLQSNQLEEIPDGALSSPHPTLAYLDFSHNHIRRIGPRAFSGLVNLQQINLQVNHLHELAPQSFHFDQRLKFTKFFLDYNDIEYISPDALRNLGGFVIQLEHNRLIHIKEDTFRPLIDNSNSSAVDLSDNKLECDCTEAWLVDGSPYGQSFWDATCSNLGSPLDQQTKVTLGGCLVKVRLPTTTTTRKGSPGSAGHVSLNWWHWTAIMYIFSYL